MADVTTITPPAEEKKIRLGKLPLLGVATGIANKAETVGRKVYGIGRSIVGLIKNELNQMRTPLEAATKIGVFGSSDMVKVFRQHKTHGFKHTVRGIGKVFVDQLAGRLTRNVIRGMTIITFTKVMTAAAVVGLVGGSFFTTVGMMALAFGISTAVYAYGKEVLLKRKNEKKTEFVSRHLLIKTGVGFGKGALGGSIGAWLLHTELVAGLVGPIKDGISNLFNLKAVPMPKIPNGVLPPVNTPAPPVVTEPPPETVRTRAPAPSGPALS